jgi:septum formation topological specificity factor MinE
MLKFPGQAPIYIIIDALDECPNISGMPTAREEVLELVEQLVKLELSNVHICVTSRPEFDIRTVLEPLTRLRVSLHQEIGQKQDIVDYITKVVHSDRMMRRWREQDKQLVIKFLSEKAGGM